MQFRFSRRGIPVVISAPSGGGKSTILKSVLEQLDSVTYSVSTTSRARRGDEVEGKSYRFVSRDEFLRMRDEKAFLEFAEVHGNYYGTPRDTVEAMMANGQDVLMDLDVQGGLALKSLMPDALLIFVMPPSFEDLERRLHTRASDTAEAIELRMRNARREIEFWPRYDYAIVNESLQGAIEETIAIIRVERNRAARLHLAEGA